VENFRVAAFGHIDGDQVVASNVAQGTDVAVLAVLPVRRIL
jgi:hypothetical protein